MGLHLVTWIQFGLDPVSIVLYSSHRHDHDDETHTVFIRHKHFETGYGGSTGQQKIAEKRGSSTKVKL
ncbi:uncharacterized protein H6S33_002411 [Morchella sextelata]|uniref:uncharacterized protein n=1 Tax=Morchella sextelata TaxID=1174677 RepID=UPI001D03D725|nr:uncharacterized protein H6S33_002411 [Morchella sextelata]KAH0607377.1 hypothetical protein H6S33_002411 [Morchella sextelata]